MWGLAVTLDLGTEAQDAEATGPNRALSHPVFSFLSSFHAELPRLPGRARSLLRTASPQYPLLIIYSSYT